jgi:hypothetical protein
MLFIPLCFRSPLRTNSGGCGGRFDYKNTSVRRAAKNERVHSRVNTKRSQIGIIALFAHPTQLLMGNASFGRLPMKYS